MNTQALLALISELYSTTLLLRQKIEELEAELKETVKDS